MYVYHPIVRTQSESARGTHNGDKLSEVQQNGHCAMCMLYVLFGVIMYNRKQGGYFHLKVSQRRHGVITLYTINILLAYCT